MAFELSEAYVKLSQRGFDTALVSVDGVEKSMLEMTTAAIGATAAFEGTLTAAIESAAGEMGSFSRNVDTTTVRVATARQVAADLAATIANFKALDLKVNDANVNEAVESVEFLIAAADDLSEFEIEFLADLEKQIAAAVEEGKRIKEIRDAVKAFDDSTKTATKSVEQLNAELTDVKEAFGDINKGAEDWIKKHSRSVGKTDSTRRSTKRPTALRNWATHSKTV